MKIKEIRAACATGMVAVLLGASIAFAEPASYRFETAVLDSANTPFAQQFIGQKVTGSFEYDSATPSGGDLPNGATLYPGSITNFSALVNGRAVSDPNGLAIVGDDKPFGVSVGDGIVVAADPAIGSGAPPEFFNLNGFGVDGYSMVNARFFWLEVINGFDFLDDQLLRDRLPSFQGRLAFDFVSGVDPADGQSVFFQEFRVTREVGVDVKPGSEENCVNINGHGVIPVAILGDATFDVLDVDTSSLTFGGLAVRVRGKRGPLCHVDYADGDAYLDMICQFEDDAGNWDEGSDTADVSGTLLDGYPFIGSDELCIVP